MTLQCTKTNLKKGSKGEQVKEVQTILKTHGYYQGRVDGEYGDLTVSSVKQFQKTIKGLAVDGIVGPVTCKHLQNNNNSTTNTSTATTLKKGSKGDNVKQLQNKLKQLGYYTADTDGDYGTKTVNAVKTYQTYYNLVSDGVCGPLTQKVLNNTPILKETPQSKRLSKALGMTIKDHGTLYQAILNKGLYILYYNDIYTYEQELRRVENKQRLNCTDWAQLSMKTLIGMGYPKDRIRIVRGTVNCNSGNGFGHVWLQLYLNGEWVNYDPSAAAAHNYKVGTLICTRSYKITNINPGWAISDDGKT